MKSFLISDNKDTVVGLRLAKIEGVLAKSEEDIVSNFENAVRDETIGIIIITEKIFDSIKEKVLNLRASGKQKLVVTIPDSTGLRDKDFIMKNIRDSIGINF